MKDDNGSYTLHADCYEPLKKAWMDGQAFFTGRNAYGDEVVLKVNAVILIQRSTPECVAQWKKEKAEEEKEEALQ